jgi:hypothetical protein
MVEEFFMPWGGRRKGAGRKSGSGKYGEPTAPVRVPQKLADRLEEVLTAYESHQKLLELLRELLEKWDKKTAYPESAKNSQKRLARELWHEVKSLLESCT